MKSRTLSSDQTAFRKLISRFSPLWVWYSVFLLLVYLLNLTGSSTPDFDDFYADIVQIFPIFNGIYGCMSAMTLFGYLCDSRECNVVHTWPIRRESHFLGRIIAGFLFHFVPDLAFFLLGLPFTGTLSYAIRWLMLMELQFITFFGIAVLCMMLSGKRLAAAALFILINSLSLLLMWVISGLYQPLLYGVELNEDIFFSLSPMYGLINHDVNYPLWPMGPIDKSTVSHFLYAAVGLVSMGLGLILYRRRPLEVAGDFIAVNWLKPVFVVTMSISVGSFLSVFLDLFMGNDELITMVILVLGLLAGYFASKMFLRRSPRVFSLKNCLQAAAIVVCMFLSLWLTKLDVFHRVEYVPKTDQIASVRISRSRRGISYTADDPAEIFDITELHRTILDTVDAENNGIYESTPIDGPSDNIFLEYTLKDGRTILRSYHLFWYKPVVWAQYYYSQPEVLFSGVKDLAQLQDMASGVNVFWCGTNLLDVPDEDALLAAMWQDCEDGHMDFHNYYPTYEVSIYSPNKGYQFFFYIPDTATYTIRYIEDHLLNDEIIDKIYEDWETNWKGYEDYANLPFAIETN